MGLVSIGVDIPCIDCIGIIRDIQSFALLAQIIGRGLRPYAGKSDCLIFDFGSATDQFGFIDAPTLAKRRSDLDRANGQGLFKTCNSCSALNYRGVMRCVRCSAEFPRLTALREDAAATPLLSTSLPNDILGAEYEGQTTHQTADGIWCVEHHMRRGPEVLRAFEYLKSRPSPYTFPRLGSTVLVRRLNGSIAQIMARN